MKLFHKLLVAPAALGLLAPMAANATELNINGVSDYTATGEQVTSITQFSDVYPTDWAYQALSNLIERYGCVAGYPNGTYRGNRAMTRFEAAALLNACLDRVTEVTDELKRLMKEFEKELAILKGRVDGLEARVGELEATQFSTTTKLKGQATFVIGANSFGGDAKQGRTEELFEKIGGVWKRLGTSETPKADEAAALTGATTFNYDQRIYIDTSFTGKDLLRTMLRAGNFSNSVFGEDTYVGLNELEVAFQEPSKSNSLSVNRLFYQFPFRDNLTITLGALVRQDEMLAVWPSAYTTESILAFFAYAGAPQAYNLALGQGAGLSFEKDAFSISANYVVTGGDAFDGAYSNAFDGGANSNPSIGGIATNGAASNGTVQIAYAPNNWGVAAAYNYSSGENGAGIYGGSATPFAYSLSEFGNSNSFGLSAWWTPKEPSWIPSISLGWGYSNIISKNTSQLVEGSGPKFFNTAVSQSWYVGLEWADTFLKGNTLGIAVGQPTFVTSWENVSDQFNGSDFIADGNYAWELWYAFQVSDNITITPAIYYLSRPLGAVTGIDLNVPGSTFNNFGGVLKTSFRF